MRAASVACGAECELMMSDPSTGWNLFACYRTWEEAIAGLSSLGGNARHVFEIIAHGRQCKGYLDLEDAALPPCCATLDEFVERADALVRRVYAEDYRVELPEGACVWMHSPGQSKVSLHLTVTTHAPQYVFRSNHQDDPQGASHLAHRLKQLDPDGVGRFVDTMVYTRDRVMRCCGSSKYERSNSVLVLYRGPPSASTAIAPDAESAITWLDAREQRVELQVPVHLPRAVRERRPVVRLAQVRRMQRAGCMAPDHDDYVACRMLELLRDRVHPSAVRDATHGAEDAYDPLRGLKFTYTDRSHPCYTGAVHEGQQNMRCVGGLPPKAPLQSNHMGMRVSCGCLAGVMRVSCGCACLSRV